MVSDNSETTSQKAEKSLFLASTLFPLEEWIPTEANIWVAKSRFTQKKREPEKWEREMTQARILTARGSVAYFLPERLLHEGSGNLCADLVMDGEVVEIKTITGTRATLGSKFKHGYKQGALLLLNRNDEGAFICFFEKTGELLSWTYEELRKIIGT